jgi:hypothetical protein
MAAKQAKKKSVRARSAPRQKPCGTVDTPKEFFGELVPYFIEWLKWSAEVDSCWDDTCGTEDARKGLEKLCRDMARWAADAKKWGDEVEDCFQTECSQPPDHTPPPPPPFI